MFHTNIKLILLSLLDFDEITLRGILILTKSLQVPRADFDSHRRAWVGRNASVINAEAIPTRKSLVCSDCMVCVLRTGRQSKIKLSMVADLGKRS